MEDSQWLGVGSRVKHPAFGDGVVIRLHKEAYDVCFITYGIKQVGKAYDKWEVMEALPASEAVSYSAAEESLIKILRNFNALEEAVPLGYKWEGGTLVLRPGEEGLKEKEMPIESFFHKIVMVRDRLRVMEQRINSSALSDEEKVNLQQYITRIYGSLTSFNILFQRKEDAFKGAKG
ncbi:hypothetical protein [Phaeodactylibacter luteus]|uniref:Uncharacterized protein n=1 Tax=Phaeodactylibacter luteus TaxID=1564516 RepID=A0A5C6S3R3_9BACT|nr:hypothetical protein [Phaeodactylibacter luteus]TXB69488.1 hypothetical protein FRY97_01380 [Phaeodactylibacter luteus]